MYVYVEKICVYLYVNRYVLVEMCVPSEDVYLVKGCVGANDAQRNPPF